MRGSLHQLETIAIRECIGKLILVRNKNDALQLLSKRVEFLDHVISPRLIQATEPFVNNHRFDTASLAAGIATDSQSQTYSYAETLTAAHQTYWDGMLPSIVIIHYQV